MSEFGTILTITLIWFVIGSGSVLADDPDLQLTQISTRGEIWTINNAGDGSNRLFLGDGRGRILIIADGQEMSTPFLDIQNIVNWDGIELGLTDLDFAPDFETSGVFYVCFTDNTNALVLARYRVSNDPNIADPNSRETVMTVAKSEPHNTVCNAHFGPDSMLYVSLGDDGFQGSGEDNAQDGSTLLGKLLRIDVDPTHGTYAIPPDNPFIGNSAVRDEIWALGLRDPVKISFDRGTGDLFISDYALQHSEINFQAARAGGGQNYGWNVMDGRSCVLGGCNQEDLTLPVAQYSHNGNCLVIGGDVYRGNAYPNLKGVYLYGDWCSGHIWGLNREGNEWVNRLLRSGTFGIAAFGLGEDGSIYVSEWGGGVYLISDGAVQAEPGFGINAGFNDAWYFQPTSGQGFLIVVWEQIKTMFLAWFTYDVERPPQNVPAILGEAGHRWITAQGPFEGATATLDVYNSSGGVFDSAEPVVGPPEKIGTMTITWTDCNNGVVTYSIPSLGLSGTVPITRIVTENAALCEALQ